MRRTLIKLGIVAIIPCGSAVDLSLAHLVLGDTRTTWTPQVQYTRGDLFADRKPYRGREGRPNSLRKQGAADYGG